MHSWAWAVQCLFLQNYFFCSAITLMWPGSAVSRGLWLIKHLHVNTLIYSGGYCTVSILPRERSDSLVHALMNWQWSIDLVEHSILWCFSPSRLWTHELAFFHPTRRMQVLAASDLGNGSFWGKKSFGNAKYTQKLYANILSSCLVHKNVYSEEIFNTNGCWLLQTLQRSWKILCFYCKKTSGHEKHTQKHVCQLKSLAAV